LTGNNNHLVNTTETLTRSQLSSYYRNKIAELYSVQATQPGSPGGPAQHPEWTGPLPQGRAGCPPESKCQCRRSGESDGEAEGTGEAEFRGQICSRCGSLHRCGCPGVALKSDSFTLFRVLPSKVDPLVSLMMAEKVPDSTYDMIGGLDNQIKEVIELPLSGILNCLNLGNCPAKGVLLFGHPRTLEGHLLARAVAHHTDCKFIRVSGSELVQRYIGEGSRMVRELFVTWLANMLHRSSLWMKSDLLAPRMGKQWRL
jgi:hypothetical protein